MLTTDIRTAEQTIVRLSMDEPLTLDHARWLRGAIAERMNRPEFHQHGKAGLIYRSPLVRYDTSTGTPAIIGLNEGAFLLRALPQLEVLRLGNRQYAITEQATQALRSPVGPIETFQTYRFCSPGLLLNQENYARWHRAKGTDRSSLLERIVVGNLLSFSKGIRLNVSERLQAEVDLQPDGWHELKPGVRLLAFTGSIRINFLLPELWGLGKSTSRGFGTLVREEK